MYGHTAIAFKQALVLGLLTVVVAASPLGSLAQDATPGATVASRPTVIASDLTNPRGFTWGPDGTLYVALAGTGGLTAGIARIDNGCPTALVEGFPSAGVVFGGLTGMADVAFLDGALYALAGGGDSGSGQTPNGVYRVEVDGQTTLVADISAFIKADPIPQPHPPDYDPDGVPYALIAHGDGFLVSEGNGGELLRATLDGTVTRVADLSAGHPVPTGLVVDASGNAYVAHFTVAPYLDGTAKVVKIGVDGSVVDYWTGLTTITALAFGPDGALYALEMSTGNTLDPPFIRPNTGKVVRRTGPATAADVVTALPFPAAMDFGPDGALYLGSPAIGANAGEGSIVRLELPSSGTLTFEPPTTAAPSC